MYLCTAEADIVALVLNYLLADSQIHLASRISNYKCFYSTNLRFMCCGPPPVNVFCIYVLNFFLTLVGEYFHFVADIYFILS